MQGVSELEMLFRVELAVLLGGFIGLERKATAGWRFRTHILVCLGSALMMLISIYAFSGILPGSGKAGRKLSAGSVWRRHHYEGGHYHQGPYHCSKPLGCQRLWPAVGSGFYLSAVAATALAVLTLMYLDSIEHKVLSKSFFKCGSEWLTNLASSAN